MRELLITYKEGKKLFLLIEDGKLVEKYEEDSKISIEGNIYVGKVQNILTGLQSAFVNIGEGKNAFIHAKDIMQKVDEKEEKVEPENIKKLVKTGDPIIVEVKRESTNYKGPRVSTHITLAGRYTVFMPNSPFITISKKIEDSKERKRLKNIIEKILPENTGAIIRTSANGESEEIIEKDFLMLLKKWEEIIAIPISEYPKMVYNKGGILRKLLIDLCNDKLEKIVVEDEKIEKEVKEILYELDAYNKTEIKKNIIEEYFLSKNLKEIENRKIWLKSGGFITIDKTEALTAIDVNSGKFIGDDNLEETVYSVNIEAAKEIAKQIRLRDIGGIIVIDFIDMHKEEDKEKITEIIKEFIKLDRSKVQVEEFTKLNLLEITRKHINK